MQYYHRLTCLQRHTAPFVLRSRRPLSPPQSGQHETLSASGQALVYIASAARRFYQKGITDTMPVIEAIHCECDRNGNLFTRDLLDSADGLVQFVVRTVLDRMEAQEVSA